MSQPRRQRLDRFPTEEWTAGSSRPQVIFLIIFFSAIPWLLLFAVTNQPGYLGEVRSAIVDWSVHRYLSMSHDLGWLLPLLFAFLIAAGIWTRFGATLSERERHDLNVRTFTSVVVGSIGVQLAILAVCAWRSNSVSGTSAAAVVLAAVLLVVVTVEVARVQPLTPLTEQITSTKQYERAVRAQLRHWDTRDLPTRTWRTSLPSHLFAITTLSLAAGASQWLTGASDAYEPLVATGVFLASLLLAGTTFMVSSARVELTATKSKRSRFSRAATIVLMWTMWSTFALVMMLTALQLVLGSDALRGSIVAFIAFAVSLSGLWTGSPSTSSWVARASLGGVIRSYCCQQMESKVARARKRRKRLKKELVKRRAGSWGGLAGAES